MPGTRKLGRPTAHRMAMLQTMVVGVLAKGRIETTYTRAAEVAPLVEKMITLGKKGTLDARRTVMAFICPNEEDKAIKIKHNRLKAAKGKDEPKLILEDVVKRLFDDIAPKYADRQGGYTRITRIGPRRGDAAEMAVLELVD